MCGRARLSSDVSEIKLTFSIPPERPAPNIAPSWNVAPTDPLPIVHYDAREGARGLEVMRWGLIPYWAKDIKIGFSTINARAEEVDTKTAAGKQPYAIALADRRLMALAGLWETWRSPAGERIRSFTIVTTTPNELCAELHNRMPVVLKPQAWPVWLGEVPAEVPQLKTLLAPYPSDEMTCWPVSPRVGNVKNNDP